MTQKITHPLPTLFFICLCLLISCKTDKKEVDTTEKDTSIAIVESTQPNQTVPSDINDKTEADGDPMSKEVVKSEEPKKPKKKRKIKPSSKKPKIQFEELTWDFGEITEGDIVEKKFKFTNIGNAPLQIYATKATCGCTMPSFPFLDIAPGDSNVIGITYNSVGKEGKQNPEITIEANTSPRTTVLKLHGIVVYKEGEDSQIKPKTTAVDSTSQKQ